MAKHKLSLTELSEKVDLTIKAKGVRFETLDAICKTLNCQPGDILEYLNEKDFKKIDGIECSYYFLIFHVSENTPACEELKQI
jgi:putative transcriptional regulator